MSLDGAHNFRDTGGLPLVAGGVTRSGVLFRSDALSRLTEAGRAQLAASPITAIVDFRTPFERASAPDALPPERAFYLLEESILEGATSELLRVAAASSDRAAIAAALERIPLLGEMYIGMLQHSAAVFVDVARLVAASDGGVLVHCTAGKDRTGIACALLLEAAGATRDAVVSDYAASADHLAGPYTERVRGMAGFLGDLYTPRLHTLAVGSPPGEITQALHWLDAQHGGAVPYLQASGLQDGELAQLRVRLGGY